MLGKKCLRLLFTRLVGEPVFIVGQCALANRRHEARQGHLVRIAEGEVRNARIEPSLAVARSAIELFDRCKSRICGLYSE